MISSVILLMHLKSKFDVFFDAFEQTIALFWYISYRCERKIGVKDSSDGEDFEYWYWAQTLSACDGSRKSFDISNLSALAYRFLLPKTSSKKFNRLFCKSKPEAGRKESWKSRINSLTFIIAPPLSKNHFLSQALIKKKKNSQKLTPRTGCCKGNPSHSLLTFGFIIFLLP